MKLFIAPEQRLFFSQHHFLECEELLQENERLLLKEQADTLLATRLRSPIEKLKDLASEELFREGRDLWLDEPKSKKHFLPPKLLQIALTLFNVNALRVGLTQYILGGVDTKSPFSSTSMSLKEFSSLQEVIGGVLISLTQGNEKSPLTPQAEGSALFLHRDLTFSLSSFFANPGQNLYLIVFTSPKTQYLFQKNDPLTHQLKRRGYVFGDLVQESTHPLVMKSF
jgi:hypothetical protein